jgi:hypothetical protein
MTSVTIQTVPTPKLEGAFWMILTTDTSKQRSIFDMVTYVVSQFPSMGDQGLSGYSYYFGSYTVENTTVGGMYMVSVLQDSSPEEMHKLWDPVLAHINSTWPGLFQFIYQQTSYPSFLAWYSQYYDTTAAGTNSYLGSRLLDRKSLTSDLTKISEALERFANGTVSTAYLVSGKGVHNAKPRGCGNAVLPAWRTAYVHASMLSPVSQSVHHR